MNKTNLILTLSILFSLKLFADLASPTPFMVKQPNGLELTILNRGNHLQGWHEHNGWTILKEDSKEKICTWKSVPATKDCDMEKDKGCKLTKPDKIGEEKIYLLEK